MNAAADSKRITLDRGTVEELTKRGRVQCRTVSLHESHGEWIVSPSLTEPVERYAVLGDAVERWCELVEHLEVRR